MSARWYPRVATQIALVLLLAFCLRIFASWIWQQRFGPGFPYPDTDSYWTLAQRITAGLTYQYNTPDARVFRAPGYPLLLAAWFGLWHQTVGGEVPLWWARLLSVFCGTVSVAGVYVLGRCTWGVSVGILAAILAAFHPESIGLGVFLLSEVPSTPILVFQLVVVVLLARVMVGSDLSPGEASPGQSPGLRTLAWLGLAAGVCGGLAALIRPSSLLLTPVYALWGLFLPASRHRRLTVGAVMIVGLILVMMPWWMRNRSVTGRFVPTTLQVGASLYDGLNPQATGASNMAFVTEFKEELAREQAGIQDFARIARGDAPWPAGLDPTEMELELDRRFRQHAMDFAWSHPTRVVQLAGLKFARMWSPWPNQPGLRSWPVRLVICVGLIAVLVPAAAALGLAWRTAGFRLAVLMWVPAGYFTLLHMIFVGSIRYRQPALLPLMVLAASVLIPLSGRLAKVLSWIPSADQTPSPGTESSSLGRAS